MTKDVHLVILRQQSDYEDFHYDSVQFVTLDYDLALKHIEDNKHDYGGELFIETHGLEENEE